MASIISAGTTSGTALNMAGDTSGVLQLATNGSTTAVTVDTSQNVGIGATSPGQKLDISTSGDIQARIGNSVTGAQFTYDIGRVAASGLLQFYGNQSGATGYIFTGINGERMRIDSAGNVGIGTTSPGVKLEIHQGAAGSRASLCVHSSASATTDGIIYSYTNTSSGTGFNHIAAQSLGAVVFKVLGNGNVQNANNSYGSTSDIKLKENIVDATPKLDDLMKVKVRHYNFIDDESKTKQIGVVAQEVEQVFSGIVENISDRDEEGNTLDSVTKSVKYSVFVPMLIKAIQEQQTIINDLKARITALEGAA
jgi:hypothetical protein